MATSNVGQMPPGITRNAVPVTEQQADAREAKRLSGSFTQWWELPGGVRLKLFNFKAKHADLRQEHRTVLDDAADFLRTAPERRVWIIGNADAGEGTASRNQSLSELRARRAWEYLSGRGIKSAQLFSISRGAVIGWGDTLSRNNRDDPGYDPAEYRMVELCLFKNLIEQVIREHHESLRRRGYNV